MRVLRISHSANVKAYRERERALQARGVEVALVCPSDWQHLGSSDDQIQEEFVTRQIRTFGTGSVPLFAYEPAPIVQMLKHFRPDVVDIHEEPYSVSGFECLLLSQKFAPSGAYVVYSAQNINKNYPPPFCWTERYVYKNSHGAYPCSLGVQEVLRAKGWSSPCPVIPLGVDPEMFTPHGSPLKIDGLEQSTFVLGFTGRLIESKGLQLILKAMPFLRQQMPAETKLKLLVAGGGPERGKLAQLAAGMGLQDSVEWLGELPQSDMPAFYRSCSVVVVPSITTLTWREQFGRVPVEAMACGVPVVASDSGSLPEVVQDCGAVVAEQDPAALGSALSKLLIDKAACKNLSLRGRDLVLQRYTWTAVADAMVALYKQAMGTGDKSPPPHEDACLSDIPRNAISGASSDHYSI